MAAASMMRAWSPSCIKSAFASCTPPSHSLSCLRVSAWQRTHFCDYHDHPLSLLLPPPPPHPPPHPAARPMPAPDPQVPRPQTQCIVPTHMTAHAAYQLPSRSTGLRARCVLAACVRQARGGRCMRAPLLSRRHAGLATRTLPPRSFVATMRGGGVERSRVSLHSSRSLMSVQQIVLDRTRNTHKPFG
jgi:hypothetical protein